MVPPKKIDRNSITGQQGINLIERILLEMGFLWYPTGGVEGGIDGTIEIRHADSGEITNSIIQVQSKATKGEWTAESETSFDYLCKDRDLEYWMNGNAPVVLVVSRPSTNEAYWVSVKDYFKDPAIRQTRKIHFDKQVHAFNISCRARLIELAVPQDAGIYFAPPPRSEKLYSNLIEVASFAPTLYVASTDCRKPEDIWSKFRVLDYQVGSEWILKGKNILSFHDLREYPWDRVCDRGTVEDFDTDEWASSDDTDTRKEFVQLLNLSFRGLARSRGLWRINRRGRDIYFFKPTRELRPHRYYYQSLVNRVPREVFGPRESKVTQGKISYYRHSAFHGRFHLFDHQWYLELSPTYHYTRNGKEPLSDDFYSQRLKGIKALEKNPSLLGQLLMWSHHLKKR